ncbi:MAG: CDP-glycerol glycerophosphotransferase family protein, partial [Clostridia bacterium]|nr:CDP-glycerol glycerophosphotransferase family protein [Clostridia bacterium]
VLLIRILVLGLRILYCPMKLRKTKNKILYLSRQSNTPSADMLALKREIEMLAPQTNQEFRLRLLRDEKGLSLSYLFGILGDMWSLASAKVAVTDTYSIPLSCLHHKNKLQTVQIWHALGAVKQFGLQSAGKAQGWDAGVSKALCMHKNYDHVIAPSQTTAEFYSKAFGCDLSVMRIFSLPRVDAILKGDCRREEFIKENPRFANKRLILYVPTFREKDHLFIQQLHRAFAGEETLGLVVAPHPLSQSAKEPLYQLAGDFSTYDLMKLCDEMITDYSACSVEASLLLKPLRFFLPDYEEYKQEQGLNVELTRWFPTVCYFSAEELVESVKQGDYPLENAKTFANCFVENKGTDNAKKLANFVCSLL